MRLLRDVLLVGIFFLTISCSTENTPVYQLTTSINPPEAGSVSPVESEFDEGAKIEITATPNDGWLFDQWEGDLSGSVNPRFLTMDSDKEVTALFKKKTYSLTVTVEGEGTVQEAMIQEKSTDYEHGTRVELTAEPEYGWEFAGWAGAVESSESSVEVTVDEPMDVTATFEPKLYELEILTEGKGSVDIKIISGQEQENNYEYGTVLELFAKPEQEWKFLEWELDEQSEENPLQLTTDEDKTIRAVFSDEETFYVAENGITIMCPKAETGEKGIVNGVEYEAVDTQLLRQKVRDETDLTTICTSLVTNTEYIFENNTSFNQPIGSWDVSNVTRMDGMFLNADSFNQSIEYWDVSQVISMYRMFGYANSFNQPIGNWDVGNVTEMTSMFGGAVSYNQPIGDWDVSSVIGMSGMFGAATSFNQPIGNWDVSNVKLMADMFYGTNVFNQDLTPWCVSNFESEPQNFAENSALEEKNKPVWGTCPD